MKLKIAFLAIAFFAGLFVSTSKAQPLNKKITFTHADTLRGTNGPDRIWWDALKYDLHVKFNIADSSISGYNIIQYKNLKVNNNIMQLDLQEPMLLDSVKEEGAPKNPAILSKKYKKRR